MCAYSRWPFTLNLEIFTVQCENKTCCAETGGKEEGDGIEKLLLLKLLSLLQ